MEADTTMSTANFAVLLAAAQKKGEEAGTTLGKLHEASLP